MQYILKLFMINFISISKFSWAYLKCSLSMHKPNASLAL